MVFLGYIWLPQMGFGYTPPQSKQGWSQPMIDHLVQMTSQYYITSQSCISHIIEGKQSQLKMKAMLFWIVNQGDPKETRSLIAFTFIFVCLPTKFSKDRSLSMLGKMLTEMCPSFGSALKILHFQANLRGETWLWAVLIVQELLNLIQG